MSRHETFRAAGIGRAHAPSGVSPQPLGIRPRQTGGSWRSWSVSRINGRRARLWSELVVLFVGVPLLMALYFDDIMAWGVLGAFSLVAILVLLGTVAAILLAITPGFSFRRLLMGPVFREWKLIIGVSALAAFSCAAFVLVLLPSERFFDLPRYNTPVWLIVLGAYPLLSALPQELIYRTLFFERYGVLFPGTMAAAAANGAAFGFGHLFYMHPVTIAFTAIGGALIGWAYLSRGRSVLLTWVLHSIAGWLIFSSGLGDYFHSGNVAPMP